MIVATTEPAAYFAQSLIRPGGASADSSTDAASDLAMLEAGSSVIDPT
jgi:hypothetical protein